MSVITQGSINQSIVEDSEAEISSPTPHDAQSNAPSNDNHRTPPSNPPNPECTIVVSNIDPIITLNDLTDVLRDCGTIKHAEIVNPPEISPTANQSLNHPMHPLSQPAERVCLIEFSDATAVDSALIVGSLNVALGDKVLVIKRYNDWLSSNKQASQLTGQSTGQTNNQSIDMSSAHHFLRSLPPPPASVAPPVASGTIYVGNFSHAVNEDVLHAFFSQAGPVAAVRIQMDATGTNRYAFVEFLQPGSAERAMGLHGALLIDRNLKIGPASNSSSTAARPGVLAQLASASPDAIVEKVTELSQVTGADPSRLTSALAKVAEAQRLVAMKMGVGLQQPLPDPVQILTVADKLIEKSTPAATGAAPVSNNRENNSRSRGRRDSRDRGRNRSRSSDRHRSSYGSSRSRRSRSRSPNDRRSSRSDRSGDHSRRSRRYSPSRSRSRSRSPHRRHSDRDRSSRRRSRHHHHSSEDERPSKYDRYSRCREPKPDMGPDVEMVFDGFNWTPVPVTAAAAAVPQ